MRWIAASAKDNATTALEKRLWDAADQLRANSGLKAQEYSGPILGLIFLRFADVRFAIQRAKLEKAGASSRRGSRVDDPAAYQAEGVLYLAPAARFDYLLKLPEVADIGAKVNAAMREIGKHNPPLTGVLPDTYHLFTGTLLKALLKKVSEIPDSVDFDAFGRIYEYFLGEFARTEGQKGGEFYTPASIVKLLTRDLLERLKQLLVLNWRQKAAARSALQIAIENVLDSGLPRAYTPELYRQKCSAVFEHVYESYPERNAGVYAQMA